MSFQTILEKRRERAKVAEEARELLDKAQAEKRDLSEGESRRFDDLHGKAEAMRQEIDRLERQADADQPETRPSGKVTRDDVVLDRDQRLSDWLAMRGIRTPGPGLGEIVRGLAFNTWAPETQDRLAACRAEERSDPFMSGLTDAGGGYLLPLATAAQVIDLARSRARVLEAGGRVFPMLAGEHRLPRIDKDATPKWRAEGEPFEIDAIEVGRSTLQAKTVGVLIKASLELAQDSVVELEALVRQSLSQSMALELDRVMLLGDGENGEPVGLLETDGVEVTPLGAEPSNYDFVVNAIASCAGRNFEATTGITSPRVARQLALLRTGLTSDERTLPVPDALRDFRILTTTQVPADLGTGEDESLFFTGDWSHLVLGVRLALSLMVLRERFIDEGMLGIVAVARADVAVTRPGAFSVVEAIEESGE